MLPSFILFYLLYRYVLFLQYFIQRSNPMLLKGMHVVDSPFEIL